MKLTYVVPGLLALVASGALAHEIIHNEHADHDHGADCGHQAIEHAGHVDYLHDGHMHHAHEAHFHEHAFDITSTNPEDEQLTSKVDGDAAHSSPNDTHMVVQHGAHFDHVHDGRLHHAHGDHIDDHGPVKLIT